MPQVADRNSNEGSAVGSLMGLTRAIGSAGALVAALALVACSAGTSPTLPSAANSVETTPSRAASTSSPINTAPPATASGTPTASPSTSIEITSPAQAAALVLSSDPKFSAVAPLTQGVVGRSSWYEASATNDGYTVSVTMGSGDCLSGCINQHTWTYSVSQGGDIKLVSEQGDQVEVSIDQGTSDPASVTVILVAGPVCPVQQASPDPVCAPRPVQNADVVLRDPSGAEVSSATADANGRVSFSVPGGAYYLEAAAAEGLMRPPQPAAFSVPGGRSVAITLGYDTGIR